MSANTVGIDLFRGVHAAIATPCDENDTFLEDPFSDLADHLLRAGLHGLYICGGTGDGLNMRLEDRKRAAVLGIQACQRFGKKAIVHVGAGNTRDAAELAEHAANCGADALASVPPINKSFGQVVDYYREVADAGRLPFFVYYIPGATHYRASLEELLSLYDLPHVAGIKFSDYDLFMMRRLLGRRPDRILFHGFDEVLLFGLMSGAQGGIGLTYNLFPKAALRIFEKSVAGDFAGAQRIQMLLSQCVEQLLSQGILAATTHLLKQRGFGPFHYRRPRAVLSPVVATRLERAILKLEGELDSLGAS